MRESCRVFVKGIYTEDEDVKEGEDAEPIKFEDTVLSI
jgi:hypothetical protein